MKEQYGHLALLVGAAVVVLLLLLRRSAVAPLGGTVSANESELQGYPNAQPINFGSEPTGKVPAYLTLNAPPVRGDGTPAGFGPRVVPNLNNDCACEANPCDQFNLQGTQKVPQSVLESAQENFLAFEDKLAAGGYGAALPMEAVTY